MVEEREGAMVAGQEARVGDESDGSELAFFGDVSFCDPFSPV